jgi:hypothetical protein
MKKCVAPVLCFVIRLSLLSCSVLSLCAEEEPPHDTADPWKPVAVLIGQWEGKASGQPGTGRAQREYKFILNEHFIHITNRSTYPPQQKNPKGETHEDIGFFSYDKRVRKLMLRQFHIEGFVNQFALQSIADDGRTLVFESIAIENIAPGWRARETYRVLSNDEFVETFALAEPNGDFATYSETHFRRKPKLKTSL